MKLQKLSTEQIFPAGTDFYHWSTALDALLSSGAFDPSRSGHGGAFFLTAEPTTYTNCSITANSDLKLFDFPLPKQELDDLSDLADGNWWKAASAIGYDGRTFLTPDPFAVMHNGEITPEVVVFSASLNKLGNFRSYGS